MKSDKFFEEMTEQSAVKIELVTKYFAAWARVMVTRMNFDSIGYVDLFSGPGIYRGGKPSTPLRILKFALDEPAVGTKLRPFFNDGNADHTAVLAEQIAALERVKDLAHSPIVSNEVVDDRILDRLKIFRSIPTLSFVDPWGYKGVTADLLQAALQGKGSECILFFNFNRFNSAVSNKIVKRHMSAFFGEERLALLQAVLSTPNRSDREEAIVRALSEVLTEAGAPYHLNFRFEQAGSERTSHYIVFATKHRLGLKIMTSIMANASRDIGGVPVYAWKPIRSPQLQLDLGFERMEYDSNISNVITNRFSGQCLKVGEIYDAVVAELRCPIEDLKSVLLRLEQQGIVQVDIPAEQRKVAGKITMGEQRLVCFLG